MRNNTLTMELDRANDTMGTAVADVPFVSVQEKHVDSVEIGVGSDNYLLIPAANSMDASNGLANPATQSPFLPAVKSDSSFQAEQIVKACGLQACAASPQVKITDAHPTAAISTNPVLSAGPVMASAILAADTAVAPAPISSADLAAQRDFLVPRTGSDQTVSKDTVAFSLTKDTSRKRQKRADSSAGRTKKIKMQQPSETPTAVSANRLKQNLSKSAFEWDGEDMIKKVTNAFEFAPEATVNWYCHLCVRADEDYLATGDTTVHVDCVVCKRTWHSQCYETEYQQDKEFWENPNISACYGCRTGWWKCMLCEKFGYEKSVGSDGNERDAEEIVFKCAETNCMARCHRKCAENELARPKTCFVRTKTAVRSKGALPPTAVSDTGQVDTDEARAAECCAAPIFSNTAHNSVEAVEPNDADMPPSAASTNTDSNEQPLPNNIASATESSQNVDGKAALLMTEPTNDVAVVDGFYTEAVMSVVIEPCTAVKVADTKVASEEDIDNTSPPACGSSSPVEPANQSTESVAVDQQQQQKSAQTIPPLLASQPSSRSSSLVPSSDVGSAGSVAGVGVADISQQLNSAASIESSSAPPASGDTKAGPKRVRPRASHPRKSRTTIAAVLPSANSAAAVDTASFSFKCGRHDCHVCKRLGRSVTCSTADGLTASSGASTLCLSNNVGKDGQFKRIGLSSCLRCCRAAHFHPHCMPPTYLVNAYNPNFMLCEDHIFCVENPDVMARQERGENIAESPVQDGAKRIQKRKKRQTRPKAKKKVDNEGKVLLTACSACALPEEENSDNLFIACGKCAAVVHRCCLPTGKDTPVDARWLCCVHDENEATSPVMLYDAVWCKDGRYPWWPARVVPWEEVPERLRKRNAATASGQYSVLYFQQEKSGPKEYAFLHSGRVLPFEESQTTEAFIKEYRCHKKLFGSLLNAIEYFRVMQRAREVLNAKTFQIFSASWEYQTIAWNQPIAGVPYVRRGSGARGSKVEEKAAVMKKNAEKKASSSQPESAAESQPVDADRKTSAADDADVAVVVTPTAALSSPKRGGSRQRQRRTAAANCTSKLVDFKEEDDDALGSKCQCRGDSGLIPCDPLTCLNAHGKIECDDRNCRLFPAIKCQNRRLDQLHAPPGCTKRYNTTLKMSNCGRKGKGLVTKANFSKGDYIIEYVGEVITPAEQTRREKELFSKYDQPMFYFMSLDSKRVLDAQYKGNLSRFANHSCDPNAKISRVWWHGDFHIVLQALRDIEIGEEVTYNYDWGTKGKNPMACNCGAKNCAGTIGLKVDKKRKLNMNDDEKSQRNKRTKNGAKGKRTGRKPAGQRVAAKKRTIAAVDDGNLAAEAGVKKPRLSRKTILAGGNAVSVASSEIVAFIMSPPTAATVHAAANESTGELGENLPAAVEFAHVINAAELSIVDAAVIQQAKVDANQSAPLSGQPGYEPDSKSDDIAGRKSETLDAGAVCDAGVQTAAAEIPGNGSASTAQTVEASTGPPQQQQPTPAEASEDGATRRTRRRKPVTAQTAIVSDVDIKNGQTKKAAAASKPPKKPKVSKRNAKISIDKPAEEQRAQTPSSQKPNTVATTNSPPRDRSRAKLYPDESMPTPPEEHVAVVAQSSDDKAVEAVVVAGEFSHPTTPRTLPLEEDENLSFDAPTADSVGQSSSISAAQDEAITAGEETTVDAPVLAEVSSEKKELENLPAADSWREVKPPDPPLPAKSPLPRIPSASFVNVPLVSSSVDALPPMSRPRTRSQTIRLSQTDADVQNDYSESDAGHDRQLKSCLTIPVRARKETGKDAEKTERITSIRTPLVVVGNEFVYHATRSVTIQQPVIKRDAAIYRVGAGEGVRTRKSSAIACHGQESENAENASLGECPRRSMRRKPSTQQES